MVVVSDRRCVISGCRELGEHLDDCNSERCKGCRPRATERGLVCNSNRTGISVELGEIPALYARLGEEPDPVDHQDWVRLPVPTSDPVLLRPWYWERPGHEAEDVLARLLPMGIVRSGGQAPVSGTRERPVPANLERLDLAADSRARFRGVFGPDQVGHVAVATELATWVRIWREDMFADHSLPPSEVPELVRWLSDRLHDACDAHPAIDDFAADVHRIRHALRRALGLTSGLPEKCRGVQCRACDRMNTLYREGGLVQCKWCGLNYSERGYEDWVALLNADARQRLRAGELLAPSTPPAKRRDPGRPRRSLVQFPDWVESQ